MRMYPELPGPRTKQLMADLSVAVFLLVCALLAWLVRTVVLTLRIISDATTSITDGIHGTWSSAADIVGSIPLVGSGVESLLQGLADGTVGNAADLSRAISDAITLTANVLAAVTFLIPAGLVAVFWLPVRIRRAQRWDGAARALGLVNPHVLGPDSGLTQLGPADADHETLVLASAPPAHLIAMRALCMMPFEDLVKYEARPFEAYAEGRYDQLVAALYAFEGLRRLG
jgi:hypothetical protein